MFFSFSATSRYADIQFGEILVAFEWERKFFLADLIDESVVFSFSFFF